MIVFDLKCRRDHVFEAWFKSGGAYDAQRAAGKIACPECGDAKVTKAPMAPRVARGRPAADASREASPAEGGATAEAAPGQAAPPAAARQMMERVRREIEARCENVGERFAEEARKIHYGEVERRDIFGRASDAEAAALSEEGVEFHRLPWPREDA